MKTEKDKTMDNQNFDLNVVLLMSMAVFFGLVLLAFWGV